MDKCFIGCASRLDGVDFKVLAEEVCYVYCTFVMVKEFFRTNFSFTCQRGPIVLNIS